MGGWKNFQGEITHFIQTLFQSNTDRNLLSLDDSGSDRENVLLAQLISGGGGGVAIRISWYEFLEK